MRALEIKSAFSLVINTKYRYNLVNSKGALNMNKKELEKIMPWIKLAIIGAIIFFIVMKYQTIIRYFLILSPLWTGIVIAYILNIPMTYLERQYEKILPDKLKKMNRILAIISVIILTVLFLYILVQIIVPQLFDTISQVIQNSSQYAPAINDLINGILKNFNLGATFDVRTEIANFINSFVGNINQVLKSNIPNIINNTLEVTASLLLSLGTFFIGFVISIYLLLSKEKLLLQLRSLIVAFVPEKRYTRFFRICSSANKRFRSFISGQILDCVALGGLCYIGMIIFGFPYAILISVLVMSLAIIPYFGAFTAMFIGSILMLPVDPMKSLYFIIYFVILQQLEGNFVYPRIVGNKVGLPGLWVLVSVILFSGIFGFMGLFFAVPITAVIYRLLKESIENRLEEKKITLMNIQEQGEEIRQEEIAKEEE